MQKLISELEALKPCGGEMYAIGMSDMKHKCIAIVKAHTTHPPMKCSREEMVGAVANAIYKVDPDFALGDSLLSGTRFFIMPLSNAREDIKELCTKMAINAIAVMEKFMESVQNKPDVVRPADSATTERDA